MSKYKKHGFVYFLTNIGNEVLYIGVTSDLEGRIYEYKNKLTQSFTARYNCNKLVYYEIYGTVPLAIEREKQLKNWKREWKNKLVDDFNSKWRDLYDEI